MASEERPNRLSRLLLTVVDLLIAALVFVLPFIMGGREAWGHWFLISVALLLATTWALFATVQGRRYSVSWLEVFLLIGLAIAWFQVQPQSASTMAQFSSEYERLLPAWSATQPGVATDDVWSTISVTPVETRHAWWVMLAYALITIVLFQRVRTPSDCSRLLCWVGIAGVSMTGFALLQWATSNDRFFWFYEHPYTEPTVHLKGAFTNRNHFAQFLSLTIGPLLWWLFRDVKVFLLAKSGSDVSQPVSSRSGKKKSRSQKRSLVGSRRLPQNASPQGFGQQLSIPIVLLLCAVAVVVLAILMSLSRGGMIAAGAASVVAFVGLWRGFRMGGALAGLLLGGGVLFFSLLAFSDQEQLQTKLDQLISADADQIDTGGNRRAVWAADAKVIQRFPMLGTGVGSHRDVYSMYMDNYADFAMAVMTHAESSFVHVALETGFVGAGCLVAALLLVLLRLIKGAVYSSVDANRAMVVAVIAGAVGAILHAVVDFIWYVPAIVVTSLVLTVVGLKAASRNFGDSEAARGLRFPRIGWAILGGFCIVGFVQVQPELMSRIEGERHWYAALRTELDVPPDDSDGYENLESGDTILFEDDPVRISTDQQAKLDAAAAERAQIARLKYLRQRIVHMKASLKANPQQHGVQLAMADQLLQLFNLLQMRTDNPFPLNMIRDAAMTSGSASADELQSWVSRAFGERIGLVSLADELARQSLGGCPVLGHAYLTLMETGFLNDPEDLQHQNLIDQAMLVSGHDPRVRFVAGREAMMSGHNPEALALWDSVFHSAQHFRLNILEMMAPQVPVEFIMQQFAPDVEELKDLHAIYQVLDRERDTLVILDALSTAIPLEAPKIEDEDERLEEMMLAYSAARQIEDFERAIRILVTVVDEFPLAFEPRYQLGATLVELERPDEAMTHLQWCHEQDPGNIWVPRLIVRARKLILEPAEEPRERLTQL